MTESDQTRSLRLAVLNVVFSRKRSIAEGKAEGQQTPLSVVPNDQNARRKRSSIHRKTASKKVVKLADVTAQGSELQRSEHRPALH
jgi:hypothetical protein